MSKTLQENNVILSGEESSDGQPKAETFTGSISGSISGSIPSSTTDYEMSNPIYRTWNDPFDGRHLINYSRGELSERELTEKRERCITLTLQWAKTMSSIGREISDSDFNSKMLEFNRFITNGII